MKSEGWLSGRQIVNCVATIGAFDGVHRGHQCLLEQVRHIADARGLDAVAITFGTSPKRVLGMPEAPQLSTLAERTALLRQMGMDDVVLLNFTPQMAAMTARDFMQQVLKEQLHVKVLVIGYDHRFGCGRSEGFDDYVNYGHEMGIEVIRGEACLDNGEPVSSTRIRQLLKMGQVDEAALLLGHRYMLHGKVVGGYREGRKMGFPTANLYVDDMAKLIPADGVYAVYANVVNNANESEDYKGDEDNFPSATFDFQLVGMLNIGYRPTLNNGQERSIEVHILDFQGDLYGKTVAVEFAHYLRGECTFGSVEELTEQLQKDKERVKQLLSR